LVPATSGPRWFDRRRPDKSWPSAIVGVGATAMLFATAFVAMRSARRWTARASETLEPPVVVRLTAPVPALEKPRTTPRRTPATDQATAPTTVPTTVPPPPIVEPLATSPGLPPAVARDTAAAGANTGPVIPLGPLPRGLGGTAPGGGGGRVPVPSGVTIGSRTANTPAYRDSVLRSILPNIPQLARERKPSGKEKAALELSQRVARTVARRATTAGNPNVHVPMGEGVDGVGAAGGGLSKVHGGSATANDLSAGSSLALPLFSSGPSAAQRRKNAAIDADYRARLGRLEDRIVLRRDSIRLDSLRRDSLRLDSLRRDSLRLDSLRRGFLRRRP
jgi:hypothetical protein